MKNDIVLIIDFGSQVSQLIARRLRELKVYCEIYPFNKINNLLLKDINPKAIILSGGPASVLDVDAPKPPSKIFELATPVLGICNGFQILTECELLPGVLMRNKKMHFICKYTYLISKHENSWNNKNSVNKVVSMPVAHHDGNYYANDQVIEKLNKDNRIAYQYCSDDGEIDEAHNINGSINSIAGIFNDKGNVLGMMPHPERAIDSSLGGEDGINFFKAFFEKLG